MWGGREGGRETQRDRERREKNQLTLRCAFNRKNGSTIYIRNSPWENMQAPLLWIQKEHRQKDRETDGDG